MAKTKLQVADGVRSLDAEEELAARDAYENVVTAPKAGHIRLFNPLYPYLKYGPGSAPLGAGTGPELIVFGEVEPGVARVPRNHMLLDELLQRHPEIRIVEDVQGRVFACGECDQEFNTRDAFLKHAQIHRSPEPERVVLDPQSEAVAQELDAETPDDEGSPLDPSLLSGEIVPVGGNVQQGPRKAQIPRR